MEDVTIPLTIFWLSVYYAFPVMFVVHAYHISEVQVNVT